VVEWEGSLLGRRNLERVRKVTRATEGHDEKGSERFGESSDGWEGRKH